MEIVFVFREIKAGSPTQEPLSRRCKAAPQDEEEVPTKCGTQFGLVIQNRIILNLIYGYFADAEIDPVRVGILAVYHFCDIDRLCQFVKKQFWRQLL